MKTTPCSQPPGEPFDGKPRVIVIKEELEALEAELNQCREDLKMCAESLQTLGDKLAIISHPDTRWENTGMKKYRDVLSNPRIQALLKKEDKANE